MRLFIDSEFTDFINTDLISFGAVTEDGKYEFYAEVSDYTKEYQSDWVTANVVPLLNGGESRMPRAELKRQLWAWIESLPYDKVTVMIDYGTDWDLMIDLLDYMLPEKMENVPVLIYPALGGMCLEHCTARDNNYLLNGEVVPTGVVPASYALVEQQRVFKTQFMEHFYQNFNTPGYRQHHALYDARANRQGWLATVKYIESI